jgi:hypothetical protein
LIALLLSVGGFALTTTIFHNELVAALVAVVVLFLTFFWLCLLAIAQSSEELSYSDKRF